MPVYAQTAVARHVAAADREIRGPIILFHGRYALSAARTIAATTLLVTVTLSSYGRRENHPRAPRFATLDGHEIDFQRARSLGGCRPLFTCFHRRTRAALPIGLLLAPRFSRAGRAIEPPLRRAGAATALVGPPASSPVA